MKFTLSLLVLLTALTASAQVDKILIPAGSPADQELQAISRETEAQKRLTMLQEFVQKFSSDPQAVAYGNSQLSQQYFEQGDTSKAMEFGEKALAAQPNNLEIIVALTSVAQKMNANEKVVVRAETYARKALELSKTQPADDSNKQQLYSGLAHSALGYCLLKQEKVAPAIPELKTATADLKNQPEPYSVALFRLGYAYAKSNQLAAAKAPLTEAAGMQGPYQQAARELLSRIATATKVSATKR